MIRGECRGLYALLLYVEEGEPLNVGGLGMVDFEPGFYLYIGSGKGTGGVAARLSRHLEGGSVKRWHIDYLRGAAAPVGYAYCCETTASEHSLYEACARRMKPYARGFGSSDDPGAYSHLFKCLGTLEECLREAEECLRETPCPPEASALLPLPMDPPSYTPG